MLKFRPLPWEYGVRNLLRRAGRTALTLLGLTTVIVLIFVVVGFIRGLDASLSVSGNPRVVLVHSKGAQENIEYSSIAASTADLLGASLKGIQERYGRKYASPELYLGTQVTSPEHAEPTFGLVRGVTPAVLSVRRQVQITEGNWPAAGEVLVGRLAATKLGWRRDALAVGQMITFEGQPWRISGWFTARGSVLESELWCPLADLQAAMKRQDLSLVAVTLAPEGRVADVELFCKEQQALDLQATPEAEYYALLHAHYGPVRTLAWLIVLLVAGAGVFAGLNTMFGAVAGRVRELAMLQTTGFVRRAIALSLIQEGTLLAALGSLIAAVFALTLIHGAAVRFTMGAFALQIDGVALLWGCGTGLLLGVVGSLPPAIRAMRLPIVTGLKAI